MMKVTHLAPSFCAAVIDATTHTLGPSDRPDDGAIANTDDSTVVIAAVVADQGVLRKIQRRKVRTISTGSLTQKWY